MVKNLKELRRKRGISQQRLADALEITQQTINKYENHKIEPDIQMLARMADYFGTTIDYLVGHEPGDIAGSPYTLNGEESTLIEQYRMLSDRERESIRLVMENYLK